MRKCDILILNYRRRQEREWGETILEWVVTEMFSELIVDLNHQKIKPQIIPSKRNKKKSTHMHIVSGTKEHQGRRWS